MPFVSVNPQPGLIKDDTPLAAEGGWVDGDKIRFSRGRPQVIGGWDFAARGTYEGIVRGAHAWVDLSGRRFIAFGTAERLYAIVGGVIRDITPPHSEGVLTDPFTTAAGSAIVTVTHAEHALVSGATVTFSNQSSIVGGLTLSGDYAISVADANHYLIVAAANAVTSEAGGGNVDYRADLMPGLVHGVGEPGGYGTGGYGLGGYGETDVVDTLPRVWFLDSWGETLVALPRNGALYQYQPAANYPELVANGDFSGGTGWSFGAGWTLAGAAAQATAGAASDLSQAALFVGGYVYRVQFDVVVNAGSVTVQTDAGSLVDASAAVSVSGHYSRLFRAPAGSARIVFHKDPAFAGSIDNVSIKLENIAYRINEAPHSNGAMFVDPHQIIVLLGTTPYAETYRPMAVRWSDRQDITAWTPSVANLAGDDILANGSRLIAGIATARQNILWSDAAAYVMQFTGDSTTPFRFDVIGTGCGIIGGLACAEHDGIVFWVGAGGNFYQFGGGVPQPIPSTLRRDVFDNISVHQGEKIVCGALPSYSEWWVIYPDSRDGKECSRYATLNWAEQTWTAGTFARSSWIDPGIYELPILFGTDGIVYFHEIGNTAAGGPIDWFIETAYTDIAEGDTLMMIRGILPDFEELQGPVNFDIYARNYAPMSPRIYGPYNHNATKTKLDMRVTGRQVKLRMGAASSPAFVRIGAVRLDVVATGQKI